MRLGPMNSPSAAALASPDAPSPDPDPSSIHDDDRHESATERLDRNWSELLQELRVVQTGVQLLTGFLLTLPFQQRFQQLGSFQRASYLVTVSLSAAATALLVAPVALHRMVFRLHARRALVSLAHRCALAGSALLGLALTGVVLLIFDVVAGRTAGVIGAVATFLVLAGLWAVMPGFLRHRSTISR